MPFGSEARSSAFASGTTSGTPGSMRQAEELSTTIAPAAAIAGLYSKEEVLPALISARSIPDQSASAQSSTTTGWPCQSSFEPADRFEEK